jgi:hypothetical protein
MYLLEFLFHVALAAEIHSTFPRNLPQRLLAILQTFGTLSTSDDAYCKLMEQFLQFRVQPEPQSVKFDDPVERAFLPVWRVAIRDQQIERFGCIVQ